MLSEIEIEEAKKILLERAKKAEKAIKFLLRGSGARFDIMLKLVTLGKASFKKLLEETKLNPASLNHHLKVLLKEGYIDKRELNPNSRSDNRVEYFPTGKGIEM
ncbi:MAG: helix-turn-helix domain-containing protein, partial [Candidatus Baldrarchaeia archaeon]